jgi:magnesium and cobalt transporter
MNSERRQLGSRVQDWLTRQVRRYAGGPSDREALVTALTQAKQSNLLDSDALTMMEGVMQVADLRVRDIMIPRASMVVIERDATLAQILPIVTESAHSRFPVIGEDRGEVVGILLAKDLLQFCVEPERFRMREVLRSAVFVPESKRLNVLLKEFRVSRNHIAIVVDEYGNAAGLVTIEDVLEQIVGEIEDEYDFDEGAQILKRGDRRYTAKAQTTIEDFNEHFGCSLDDDSYDTLGGLVVNALGHVPKRGEMVEVSGFRFLVLRADSRRVLLLDVEQLQPAAEQVNRGGH